MGMSRVWGGTPTDTEQLISIRTVFGSALALNGCTVTEQVYSGVWRAEQCSLLNTCPVPRIY
jgi:hypothetical protein